MSTELYLMLVPRAGIEPATQNFSGFRSTIWAISIYGVTTGFDPYLGVSQTPVLPLHYCHHWKLADAVGFEPTKLHFNVTCFLSRKVISTSSSTHLYHSVLILLVLYWHTLRFAPCQRHRAPHRHLGDEAPVNTLWYRSGRGCEVRTHDLLVKSQLL